jgi:hypothetical protein
VHEAWLRQKVLAGFVLCTTEMKNFFAATSFHISRFCDEYFSFVAALWYSRSSALSHHSHPPRASTTLLSIRTTESANKVSFKAHRIDRSPHLRLFAHAYRFCLTKAGVHAICDYCLPPRDKGIFCHRSVVNTSVQDHSRFS